MNGYALVFSACYGCKQTFGYNPHLVPSMRVNGIREPVCERCLTTVNIKREANGDKPHPVAPGAYEPIREEEL